MAPAMDIDENDTTTKATTTTTTTTKAPKKLGTPSSSAENASPHPNMALAQSIHRLTMYHTGKLSKEDAAEIMGMEPEELLERVMSQVGTGGKSVADVIAEGEKKLKAKVDGEFGDAKKDVEEVDEENEPLLNPSLYEHLQSTLYYTSPTVLSPSDLSLLTNYHTDSLATLSTLVTNATEEAGDMEVLQAKMDIARYAAKSCTKEEALKAYEEVVALPKLSTGKKMDAFLEMARVASFWGDWKVMRETLDKASKAIAKGGDWDRRNRLKAYQAISHILVRDMESASKLLVDGIATFSCGELCEYSEFITYAVVTSLLYLPRTELKKSIIDGSEILQVAKEIPVVIRLANTLYDCDYTQYLHTIAALQPHLIANRYLQPHAGYLLREFHVLGFKQFLDSYQSVTLESMASSFGVGTEFLDVQLSRFIAAGRLTAKIDKFGGVVETNRPDEKNARYRDMIQKGDLLLNRIQKLGRVVDL